MEDSAIVKTIYILGRWQRMYGCFDAKQDKAILSCHPSQVLNMNTFHFEAFIWYVKLSSALVVQVSLVSGKALFKTIVSCYWRGDGEAGRGVGRKLLSFTKSKKVCYIWTYCSKILYEWQLEKYSSVLILLP